MKKKFSLLLFIVSVFIFSCNFMNEMAQTAGTTDYNSLITRLTLSKSTLNVTSGESEMIKLSVTPSEYQGKCNVTWDYDSEFLEARTDNFGAIITGKKPGSTFIKAKCNGIVATCLISVISNGDEWAENPYIYSNYSVIQLMPNDTMTVSASLYGGSITDMEDFTWEIKDPSVASIAYSRNNCIITGLKTGSTQLTAHHPKAEYDYTFVVYIYTDKLTETYITTDYNVMTLNRNVTESRTITVDLVNPINAAYKNGFTWQFADEESKEIISMSSNLNTAEIIPLKNGIAKITVKHENSQYDLNIIIRVTTIVKNTYIGLSESTLVVTGSDAAYSVTASLENYEGFVNPEEFVFEIPPESYPLAECTSSGNVIKIQGKKNGSFKIKVSHSLSEYSRNLLVILEKQIGSAVDASMYITTNQNYVQTQVGKEPVTVNVRLIGGVDGVDNIGSDAENFNWYIKNGRSNDIIEVQNVTGYVKDLNARSAVTSGESCPASIVIKPLKAGETTIVVTHPRCLYDTEINVKVYSESALVNPKTITTQDSLIKLLNGQSKIITASLRNNEEGDENRLTWTSDDPSKISVSPSTGLTTQITACGTGSSQNYITAHLDNALSDKKILILQAATEDDLNNMKGIYADNTYLRIAADEEKTLNVTQFGFTSQDRISWTSSDSSICLVNGISSSPYCTEAKVTGLREGKAIITANAGAGTVPVSFDVTVLKAGESSDIFDENAGYLTTNLNAVVLENIGDNQTLTVNGVNISSTDMALFTDWTITDLESTDTENVFDLYGTPGSSITLTARKTGKSNIKVTNKMSMNSLNINAKCGELYEWNDDYIVYITAENDVVNMMNGESKTIACSLVNTTQTGTFSWQVTQGADKIEIIGNANGVCNIKAKEAGQAIITVSNSLAGEITKELLVNIANSGEELKGFRYLTTKQNVVTVGETGNVTVNVEIKNADTNVISGYSWRSTNSDIATVSGSGNIAVVYGKKIGSAKIIVENYEQCSYPLEIIVNVVDPVAAAEDPYISCNNIVTCTVNGDSQTISAELIGGKSSDTTGFNWSIVDSKIANLYASNDTAQIRAIEEGVTQVIVSHPRASVSRTILVICEPKPTTNCYINLTESIIKMSPTDESKTITATLINGDADDMYDFKWWADSYDKINMNYTGASCLIEPISSGTVTIHCSHPKATSVKDIVLYISNYTDFAFAKKSIELETGSDTFINLEVPATGVDCDVSYSSSNNSLCTAFGNNSVCTLHPGTLPAGYDSYTCIVTATLQTKGGVKQAEAQLLVSVTKKDETKPYIGLSQENSSTIITMNKGEVKNISAKLYGNTVDTESAGLKWEINNGAGNFIEFTSSKTYGRDVQIRAVNSGKTTITITHDPENGVKINPLTIYVIVTGVDEPTVTLNYSTLPVYMGEDAQTLQATVKNDTGEELEWTVVNDEDPSKEQKFFKFSAKGNKATVFPLEPGSATVYCKIPSNNSTAVCKVEIRESEKLNFFVYDDELNFTYTNGILDDRRTKYYINTLQLFPGDTKLLHYEAVPAKCKITNWFKSDSNYFDIDTTSTGYIESWTDPVTHEVYHYPDGVGTVLVTGKENSGSATLQATTERMRTASVVINNSYNYLFTTNKSMIISTPKEVHDKKEIMYVDYEIRPACSKLIIINTTPGKYGENITLKNGIWDAQNKQWTIDTHETTEQTSSTGIAKGTLQFEVNGEVNCNIQLVAVNENVITSGTTNRSEEFNRQNLKVQVFYQKHSFSPVIKQAVPYLNHELYGSLEKNVNYSYYDKATNTIFLGDGEYLFGDIILNEDTEPYSNCYIESVQFKPDTSSQIKDKTGNNEDAKSQYDYVGGNTVNSGYNNTTFQLFHVHDYSILSYYKNTTDSWVDLSSGINNMYRLIIENDKWIENSNETIKETSYVGCLVVTYINYSKTRSDEFKIPVYVQVRNCPCAETNYYKPYKD